MKRRDFTVSWAQVGDLAEAYARGDGTRRASILRDLVVQRNAPVAAAFTFELTRLERYSSLLEAGGAMNAVCDMSLGG